MTFKKYKIPKSFKLFNTVVKIVFDNKLMYEKEQYGQFSYGNSKITLANKLGHEDLSNDRVKDCFYHEKVHAILAAMDERDLNENEKFVDIFAKLLRQSDETAIY